MASSASALTIGVNWDGTNNNFEAIYNSGAAVYHVPLAYNGPGGDWSGNDHLVEEAWKRGIAILPTLSRGSETRFLRSSDPGWGPWGTWVKEVVERYGVNGSFWNGKAHPTPITAWEVWNEPNLIENNPKISKKECTSEGLSYEEKAGTCYQPKAYGSFLKYTAEMIQAASYTKTAHGTEVLFGGLYTPGGYEFMSFLEKAAAVPGVAASFTGFAIHPYAFVSGLSEFETTVRKARSWSNEIGLGGKSIWITEMGWPVGGTEKFPPGGHVVSPEEQASLLTNSFNWLKSVAAADNIPFAAWFNIRDYKEPKGDGWAMHCGLLDESGNPRPDWAAFQAEAGGPPPLGAGPAVLHEGSNWWIFYRGADGALWEESLAAGGEWTNYRIGSQVAPGTTPAVLHEGGVWWVFYQGADGALHEESLVSGGEWSDYRIGGAMSPSSSPTALQEGGVWRIFYRGADGALWQESLVSGGEWTNYWVGGEIAPRTTPVVHHEGGIWRVFYQGADHALWLNTIISGGGGGPWRVGGEMAPETSPVVQYESGIWRVFYQGSDHALWLNTLVSGGEGSNWRVGGEMAPRTSPVVQYEGGIWRVFYQGSDHALWLNTLVSGGEGSNWRVGGGEMAVGASPTVQHEAGYWHVFYQGSDHALWLNTLVSGGGGGPWRIGGEF